MYQNACGDTEKPSGKPTFLEETDRKLNEELHSYEKLVEALNINLNT